LRGKRIQNERAAFVLGMAAGAGFAILENMGYQGVFAQFYGWSWGCITAL
jgi:RsiW-degrading membrane proteinase PrsW (M82 family)